MCAILSLSFPKISLCFKWEAKKKEHEMRVRSINQFSITCFLLDLSLKLWNSLDTQIENPLFSCYNRLHIFVLIVGLNDFL